MANEKLTKREDALAKRVGKGGHAFVVARRKRPGMSLLEWEASRDPELSEDLDVTGTAAAPVTAAPVSSGSTSTEPTRVTGPAKKTAAAKTTAAKKTTPGGSSTR